MLYTKCGILQYKTLYSKCFNAITDYIEELENKVAQLKNFQQELEDMYMQEEGEIKQKQLLIPFNFSQQE